MPLLFEPCDPRRRSRVALLAFALVAVFAAAAHAQQPAPTSTPTETPPPSSSPCLRASVVQPLPDDLAEGRRLLQGVRDNVFSFDDPAFYWFCRHVRQEADASLFQAHGDESPTAWKLLLERPSDYRGRLVIVEGILQAVHVYDVSNRAGIGTLYQCELSDVGTRAFCTVVAIVKPDAAPLRSRVRAKGFFIKVRAFQTSGGEAGAGPLLVARALEVVQASSPSMWNRPPGGGLWSSRNVAFWLLPGTAGLAIVWLILRRSTRVVRPGAKQRSTGASGHITPESDEDFDWLTKSGDDQRGGEQ